MKIAIIDDGVTDVNTDVSILRKDLVVKKEGNIVIRTTEKIISNHGSICAHIILQHIKKYLNTKKKVEFYSLCIFENKIKNSNLKQLEKALEWCLDNQILIIHLSIGTRDYLDFCKLQMIIGKMIRKGHIIIAANSNYGEFTMPACMSGVFGVEADIERNFRKNEEFDYNGKLIKANSIHELWIGKEKIKIENYTNSFAAPVVTAKICELILESEENLKNIAQVYSKIFKNCVWKQYRLDFIDKVCVLNLGGYSIKRRLLSFEIKEEYKSIPDFFRNYKSDFPILIIPDNKENNNRLILNIHKLIPMYLGIIFAGKLSKEIDEIRRERFIWDETGYNNLYDTNFEKLVYREKKNIPAIWIVGSELNLKRIIKIRETLECMMYRCLCISNVKMSYLYNIEYVDKKKNIENVIEWINIYMNVDVILIYVERIEKLIKENDVILDCNKEFTNSMIKKIIKILKGYEIGYF